MNITYALEMKGICKQFPGVKALDKANLNVKHGEVHALMGENGAGKSTLIKVLGGIHLADAGEILIEGEKVFINSVKDAEDLGIGIIHQEISLVNDMTVAENIFLGREPKNKLGFVDYEELYLNARKVLDRLGLDDLSPYELIGKLSIAQKQMIEIARAISKKPKIIVMDEPTSSLTNTEVEDLFKVIEQLKNENVAIIYISHRMDEIFRISDRITVFRDGCYVGTDDAQNLDHDKIVHMMVGRDISQVYTGDIQYGTDKFLEIKNFNNKYLDNVSFDVRKGEVFGISGLVGAGRTELARAIIGIDKLEDGVLVLDNKKGLFSNTEESIKAGIVLVPEDRKSQGLILNQTIKFNMTIAVLHKFIKLIKNDAKYENDFVEESIKTLTIKTPSSEQVARNLSGGNQQKLVIAKWLATEPKVLILDEPTRGIDVGAKAEIYNLITEIASEGVSVIMISSELQEIINLSSRVAVMYEGRLMKIIDRQEEEITQEKIMYYATGGEDDEE